MEATKTIRVMIVDDHDMVRHGLGLMIDNNEQLERAGEAKTGEMALNVCEKYQPDVILMDMILPDVDGIQTTQEILKRYPHIKVIVLTSFDTTGYVSQALKVGATSYLKKNVRMQDLVSAIQAAYIGKASLSPEAAQELIADAIRPPKPGHDLTDREQDVLKLLVKGLNNPQIGDILFISRSTVKNHVSSILRKLEASTRSEVVAIALKNKILDDN